MFNRSDLAHYPLWQLLGEVRGQNLGIAAISKRAMRLLMHKQYAGKPVPDCASLRELMA